MSSHITAHTQRYENGSSPATTGVSVGWWAQLVAASSATRCFLDIVSTGSASDNIQVSVSGTEGLQLVRDNGVWSPGVVATLSHDVWYRFWVAIATGSTRAKLWWGAAGAALSSAEDTTTIGGVTTPKIVVGSNLVLSRFGNCYMSAVRPYDAEIRDEPTIEAVLARLVHPGYDTNLWANWPLLETSTHLKDFGYSNRALTLPGGGSPADGPNPNGLMWGRTRRRFVRRPAAAGATAYTLTASPGAVTITGTAATLKATRLLTAAPGSVAVAGTAATLTATRLLTASPGAVTITGTAATLSKGQRLTADPGSVAITGTAATLTATRLLTASPGAIALTGTDAALRATRLLTASPGAVALTGTAASLLATRLLTCSPGSVTITGTSASFIAPNGSSAVWMTFSNDGSRTAVAKASALRATLANNGQRTAEGSDG